MKYPADDVGYSGGTPWADIVFILEQRRANDTPLVKEMQRVRDHYNCDLVIPLAEVDGEPVMPYASPHVVADTIDATAMRAASTRPICTVPALDPTSVQSRKRAETTRRAYYAAWHKAALWDVLLYRSYRQLIGYGTNAFAVVPDLKREYACIEIRDPLTAYPDERSPEEVRLPTDVGFVFGRSTSWVRKNFGSLPGVTDRITNSHARGTDLWDIVEWIDEHCVVIGLLGPRYPATGSISTEQKLAFSLELSRVPNRAGLVPCSVPRRVTLDRVAGQVSSILDQEDLLGKLTALDIVAAEKAIFPDMVAMAKDGTPRLVSGSWKDGRTGEVNLVENAEVRVLQSAPGPLTHPVIDRVERGMRVSSGNSPFFGGETTGSLRTGRAIDSLGGYSVDPRIEEAQKLMSRGLMQVNEAWSAVTKGYWPTKSYTVFSGWPGEMGHVKYVPDRDFETTENVVAYPMPGTDRQGATVAIAQSTGAGLMSRTTGRRKHPDIENPEKEEELIQVERLEDALLQSLLQQAVAGELPAIDLANIMAKRESGMPLPQAVAEASREAQERQAREAPPAPEPGMLPPGTQPGLAMPGRGVEEKPPADEVPPPRQALQNFRSLLVNLRSDQ